MTRKRPFTPEDFYLISQVSDPNLSPDGKLVAYVQSCPDREDDETRHAIYIAPADGSVPARRFTEGKKDYSPRWSPDGRQLAFISERGEKNQLFVAPIGGGEARQVTKAKWGISSPAWSPDGKRIAYAARTGKWIDPKERKGAEKNAPRVLRGLRYKLDGVGFFDERRLHLFVCDVATGEARQITAGDWDDEQPAWSPDGKTIVFVSDRERDRHNRHWRTDVWRVSASGGKATRLTRALGSAAHPTYSPNGQHIAFVGHENGDEGSAKNSHLMLITPRGGVPKSLSVSLDRPASGWPAFAAGRAFNWSRDSKSLLFLAGDRGTQALYRATLSGKCQRILDGERQIESFVTTADGKRVLFTAAWPSVPWELYSASLGNGRRELNLSHANEKLVSEVEISDVHRMTYRAADGLEIETFLIYPPNYRPGRRYPLAVNVHGGPHGWHPGSLALSEFQSLAAKGYVVSLPNPRGSATYGEAFCEACVRDWGGKDYEDILTGIDLLIEKGIADPGRLYIGGYSYGGFMASWAVGHTDRFRAAMVGAPCSDQLTMFGNCDIPLFDMHEIGGIPQTAMEEYIKRSPIAYLQNCTTPVLLVHHEGDLRCPIGQSEEIFHALVAMRKEVEFVRYPGGFHRYMTHAPSQAVDRMKRTIAWFEDHPPKRKAAKAKPNRARRAAVKSR
jgi:dipeptidyl aminopeptidase/acylaminoacyl peptidase